MNNIYAKTVHKKCSTPRELHPITSARGVEGALKAPIDSTCAVGAGDTATYSRFC